MRSCTDKLEFDVFKNDSHAHGYITKNSHLKHSGCPIFSNFTLYFERFEKGKVGR